MKEASVLSWSGLLTLMLSPDHLGAKQAILHILCSSLLPEHPTIKAAVQISG
jgi:hypothetical protein